MTIRKGDISNTCFWKHALEREALKRLNKNGFKKGLKLIMNLIASLNSF